MNDEPVVWIVNHYAAVRAKDGWDGRHQALASEIVAFGWKPVLFFASTSHPSGVQHLTRSSMRSIAIDQGVMQVMLRAPQYTGGGAARVLNMLVFSARLALRPAVRGVPVPDVVIGSTVHPLAAWVGMKLARRHQVPFVFEIRDVWPDALVHLNFIGPHSLVTRGVRAVMRRLVRGADLVLSPLASVNKYLVALDEADKPFVWVSNGADAESARYAPEPSTGAFTFMYLGSLGRAMDLDTIIRAYALVEQRSVDREVALRIVGDGERRAELEVLAESLRIRRFSFEDRIPREVVVDWAQEAHCLVHALHDHPVYEFGISPNKLFDYLASGRPVVLASNTAINPVEQAHAGICVPAEDEEAMAEAMQSMLSATPDTRREYGVNGVEHLRDHFTYAALAERLDGALRSIKSPRGATPSEVVRPTRRGSISREVAPQRPTQ